MVDVITYHRYVKGMVPATVPDKTTTKQAAARMPEKLAAIAFRLFSEHGLEKVSLDRVAEEAGVTKGSLYSHYRSKNELFAAACQIYYRQWDEKVQAMLAREPDPFARIEQLLRFSLRRCVTDRKNRAFTTELFALSLRDSLVRSGWGQFYSAVREQFVALVTAAQASGKLQQGDPRRRVDLMLCALEGLKFRSIYESEIADETEMKILLRELLEILGANFVSR